MKFSFLDYNFLILSSLFLIPGTLVYILRDDLRPVIHTLAICSVPFAFTEFLFYPTYWEPKFLWDLINVIGFGIEDIMFVVGLSAFTSTCYAFIFRKKIESFPRGKFSPIVIIILFFISFLLCICFFVSFKIHLIYGAPILMFGVSVFIFLQRKDLILPGILGAILSTLTYALLCYILLQIYPNIFELTWHTEKFLNVNLFNLPIEELLYAFNSGCVATLFYPYVFSFRYVPF
jgi:hypothetical protein